MDAEGQKPIEGEPGGRLGLAVYRNLEDMIFSGQLKAGDVITERRLSAVLGVSRTPLRDALLRLESEGLLKRRGSRYLEVAELSIPEFMQILNIRRLLEPEAARLAVGKVDRQALVDVRARLEATLASMDGDERDTASIDGELHGMIADAAGNPLMANIIADLRRRTRIFDLQRMPERFAAGCHEHIAIVDALLDGDAQAASDRMVVHIDNVKASIVGRLAAL